jgi:hypothetical protein
MQSWLRTAVLLLRDSQKGANHFAQDGHSMWAAGLWWEWVALLRECPTFATIKTVAKMGHPV